jgi:phytoene synthase
MTPTIFSSSNEPAESGSGAEAVMASSGRTFHQAARLLPREVRGSVVALYAFCRQVDDLADESTQPLAERNRQLRDLQRALLDGQTEQPDDGMIQLPKSLNLSHPSRQAAAVLVGAAREDLTQEQPEDEIALVHYAFGVAGTVGLMMADVLRARRPGMRAAVELGIAMQLSNIARDVAQDLQAGRLYLPASWISRLEVEGALQAQDLRAEQRLQVATMRLLHLAEVFYEDAFTGFWTLPLRVRWSILSAALCYREIGVYVGNDIRASWQKRAVVPSWRKLILISFAAMRMLLPKYWSAKFAAQRCQEHGLLDCLPMLPDLAEAM